MKDDAPPYADQFGEVHVIDDLATLKLISDPLRLRILELARGRPRTVKEIAAELDLPPTKLYYHIRLLEEHGLLVVAGTRIVSGIVERHFQTVAARLAMDRRLLGGEQAGGLEDVAISLVLDETRADVHRSIAAGLVDVTREEPAEGGLLLGRIWRRWSVEQAQEFSTRFKELEMEITARASKPEDQREYQILLALFPLVRADDDPNSTWNGEG